MLKVRSACSTLSNKIFIRETQILKVKRIKIWKSNNPAKDGGF
jgi:hypothetical protein